MACAAMAARDANCQYSRARWPGESGGNAPGSASFIAMVGSALLCSRWRSFSLWLSTRCSFLLSLFCDLSDCRLKPLDRGRGLAVLEWVCCKGVCW